jgi:hypothetical protein
MVLPVPGGASRIRFSARSTNASQFADQLAVDRRLKAEVELEISFLIRRHRLAVVVSKSAVSVDR